MAAHSMTWRKGLFGNRKTMHLLPKGHDASQTLACGKHTTTPLLVKKLIFQEKTIKLPSMYMRFTIKRIWKDQKSMVDFLLALRAKLTFYCSNKNEKSKIPFTYRLKFLELFKGVYTSLTIWFVKNKECFYFNHLKLTLQ